MKVELAQLFNSLSLAVIPANNLTEFKCRIFFTAIVFLLSLYKNFTRNA
jgi:hypothetical protein